MLISVGSNTDPLELQRALKPILPAVPRRVGRQGFGRRGQQAGGAERCSAELEWAPARLERGAGFGP